MYVIDTNVAIHLRDGDANVVPRLRALPSTPAISIVTWAELEGGVHALPAAASFRRAWLDALLEEFRILPFDRSVVKTYADIVAALGFSRPRILDRLIAATALVNDLTLITINAADFRDIPGLALEAWPAPAQ